VGLAACGGSVGVFAPLARGLVDSSLQLTRRLSMSLPHHNLIVWQRADDLFLEVHLLTRERFPAIEKYELGSQVRRAGYSVPANIVEGIARKGERESINFFNIASASLSELGYGLHAAWRLGYISREKLDDLEQKIRMVSSPLRGLIRRYRVEGALAKAVPVTLAGFATWFLLT
jgi:four helix bundle protein